MQNTQRWFNSGEGRALVPVREWRRAFQSRVTEQPAPPTSLLRRLPCVACIARLGPLVVAGWLGSSRCRPRTWPHGEADAENVFACLFVEATEPFLEAFHRLPLTSHAPDDLRSQPLTGTGAAPTGEFRLTAAVGLGSPVPVCVACQPIRNVAGALPGEQRMGGGRAHRAGGLG